MFSFFRCRLILNKFPNNSTKVIRNFAEVSIFDEDLFQKKKNPIEFFMNLLDYPNAAKIKKQLIEKNGSVRNIDQDEIVKSLNFLRKLNIPLSNIRNNINILSHNAITLQNHYEILKESGFTEVNALHLIKFVVIMNRPVYVLKANEFIANDLSVADYIAQFANIKMLKDKFRTPETESLKILRKNILKQLVLESIGLNENEFEKFWNGYPSGRNRPMKSVVQIIDVLKNDLNFNNERIRKHPYLLFADPENVKNILFKLKTICGIDCRDILNKRPKIAMANYQRLNAIQNHIRDFGIPDEAIKGTLEILTLGPDTVYERLLQLRNVKEFEVLINHPRVLKLVAYQNKARLRLEYLKQLKIKCVSLHVLSGNTEVFERYVRDGSDKTQGRDVVSMLSKVMDKSDVDIRNELLRHPNWCHVPAVSIRATLDQLKNRQFSIDDIFDNIQILLYPIERIDQNIAIVNGDKFNNLQTKPLTKSQRLRLSLYLIELEYHFTGDGIWTEPIQHTTENYRVPDIPPILPNNKSYKYGRVQKEKMESS